MTEPDPELAADADLAADPATAPDPDLAAGDGLRCDDLSIGYGGLAVGRGIDLSVRRNEILAVLGPNGAGKTTLLLTIGGFLPPLGGSIRVGGAPLAPGSPRRANRAGVVLVPDSRALFTQLTAVENLKLGARNGGPSVDEMLDLFPALARRAKVRAGMLSGGEQQMLAVARALVQGPSVLLIDEMSMGLAPVVVESLMPVVRRVADESDAAVVLVEQHVRLALEIADQAVVLVHGDVTLSGPADELATDPAALEAAYLGHAI
ncbi:MAG: ABC transporter ATP-binding protein [Acidimicrobiales bacterium]|nr:ABC transporter ATP-binding protein [Acidimicrobiales bacterium]